MHSNFNIITIIRASFEQENIRFFLERGHRLGLKYFNHNIHEDSNELTIDQIIASIRTPYRQSKLEIKTKTDSVCFSIIFEHAYSPKADELGLGCHFKNITFEDPLTRKNKPEKVKFINLMLSLIADYFIYELHALEGEYNPKNDY